VLGASIIGELEIIQLIASIELKMGRVGSIADREHAARAQLGRLQRVEIDVREINMIRAGERAVAAETGDGAGARFIHQLTAREQQVVLLVSDAISNKEIARRLDLTEGTVKVHLHNIYEKLGVSNRTALTVLAIAHRDQLRP
jgi:DNA-binding NarL/FixJ family response regulator